MILPIGDQPNPRGVPYVNYFLIATNAVVFLLIAFPLMGQRADPNDPLTQAFLRYLLRANPDVNVERFLYQALQEISAYDVFLWQWGYRPTQPSMITLFFSMFLHGGWLHLIGNMLFLWIYGDNVEHRLGRFGYLAAYLASGALATLGYSLVLPSQAGHVPLVGASGAISGVLGFYFIWFPRNKVRLLVVLFPFFFDVWLVGARWVLGFYLIVDNLLPYLLTSQQGGGVAHGAHLGGFIAGTAGALLIDLCQKFWCRRRAHHSGTDIGQETSGRGAELVLELHQYDSYAAAIRAYLALDAGQRRRVPAEAVADLADWLAEQGNPDGALALYQQAEDDHPRDEALDRIFLGMGLVLLRHKHRPTAAYQYLLQALEAHPRAAVEKQAREALANIEQLQKHTIRPRRW